MFDTLNDTHDNTSPFWAMFSPNSHVSMLTSVEDVGLAMPVVISMMSVNLNRSAHHQRTCWLQALVRLRVEKLYKV